MSFDSHSVGYCNETGDIQSRCTAVLVDLVSLATSLQMWVDSGTHVKSQSTSRAPLQGMPRFIVSL